MSTAVILPWIAAQADTEAKPVCVACATPSPEMAFYRKYTEGLLRRYMRLRMEAGRVSSLMGREMFRGRASHYAVQSFDDVVIFTTDVERCLAKLDAAAQKLVNRIAMQEYTQAEVAEGMGVSVRSVMRRYNESLDELTAIFLERKILEPMTESCQAW